MIFTLITKYLAVYDPKTTDHVAFDNAMVVYDTIMTLCEEKESIANLVLIGKLLEMLPNIDQEILKLVYYRALDLAQLKKDENNQRICISRLQSIGIDVPNYSLKDHNTQKYCLQLKIQIAAHLMKLLMEVSGGESFDKGIIVALASFLTMDDVFKYRLISKSTHQTITEISRNSIPYQNRYQFVFATTGIYKSTINFEDGLQIYSHTIDTQFGKDESALFYKIKDIELVHKDGTYKQFARHGTGFNGRIYCPEISNSGQHIFTSNMTWLLGVIHCQMSVFVYSPMTEENLHYYQKPDRAAAFAAEIVGLVSAGYEIKLDTSSDKFYLIPPANASKTHLQEIIFTEQVTQEKAKEIAIRVNFMRAPQVFFQASVGDSSSNKEPKEVNTVKCTSFTN